MFIKVLEVNCNEVISRESLAKNGEINDPPRQSNCFELIIDIIRADNLPTAF